MPKKDADTNIQRIARKIVESAGDPDMEDMLHEMQSAAIVLAASTSELIGLMKRHAAATEATTENPQIADKARAATSDEEPVGEPGEAESKDEKD